MEHPPTRGEATEYVKGKAESSQDESVKSMSCDDISVENYETILAFFHKKMWYELSVKIIGLARDSHFEKEGIIVDLYSKALRAVENEFNPLQLAKFAVLVSQLIKDPKDALAWLKQFENRKNEESNLLIAIAIAYVNIQMKEAKEARRILLGLVDKVTQRSGVDPVLISSYFYVSGQLHHSQNIYHDLHVFYEHTLLHMEYEVKPEIFKVNEVDLARDLAEAALFSIGELIDHPILKALKGTEFEYLTGLLRAFYVGDIANFEDTYQEHKDLEVLSKKKEFILRKVRTMALIDMVFHTPPNSRLLTFKSIQDRCNVKESDVEWLLMKAMALGLITGKIDEVAKNVRITSVKPKALSEKEIVELTNSYKSWATQLHEAAVFFKTRGAQVVQ